MTLKSQIIPIMRLALLLTVAAAGLAMGSGCVVLPAEGQTLVSDVHETKMDIGRVRQMILDSHTRLSQWQDSFRETEAIHFSQLRDRLIEIEMRLEQIEKGLVRLQAATAEQARASEASASAIPVRSALLTTAGVVLDARDLLRSAQETLVKENYEEAERLYRSVLTQFPDSDIASNAQFGVAECLEYQDQLPQALEAYLSVPERFPAADNAPQARFRAAMCARKLGDRSQALSLLNDILRKHPSFEEMARVNAAIEELQKD